MSQAVHAASMPATVARRLAELHERGFGGKVRGRYRISMKYLRRLSGRSRLYPEDVGAIARELYQRGFILIDLESFFVVLSQRTFASYRRVNADSLSE